ncbi:hypothetical protein GCM10010191_25450 [Actinomadura vinacea]|uniref:AB hydrolase-1 domain-containing protein n=1 Tax=Actinomadura vinacea TaxID=115336 RepID=A0ABN3IUQ5_9ACTN
MAAFVHARGARFNVVDLGPADGVPLVMLHGLFTGSAASWFFTVAPALARTRPVRLPDWRGHGLSERTPSGYGTADMAADLAALTAGLPPFALAGHSYGAAVAVRFALDHPGRVTRLALIDPPFAGALASVPGMRESGRRSRVRALVEHTRVLDEVAAEPPVTADVLAGLEGLPVLAVAGAESPFRAALDLVGRALPAARCHVLPGGHDVHITARHLLAPLLEDFLDREVHRACLM